RHPADPPDPPGPRAARPHVPVGARSVLRHGPADAPRARRAEQAVGGPDRPRGGRQQGRARCHARAAMADGLRHLIAAAAALAALRCAGPGPTPEPRTVAPAGATAGSAPWRSFLLDEASPCRSAAPVHLDRELIAWSDWIASYAAQHGHEHAL